MNQNLCDHVPERNLMQEPKKKDSKRGGKWYEKYLPFIARSREKQIQWLINAFRKKTLSLQEITPYIKLLLEEDDPEGLLQLRENLAGLDDPVLLEMLHAADIYDTVKLLNLLPEISIEEAIIAFCKEPPPYERTPEQIIDQVFEAVHNAKPGLLEKAGSSLLHSGKAPSHFPSLYARFLEILKDQELLSTLYPKARSQ
ncbi:MAG: hypothetical protein P8130_01170 [Deltaproteobacteria bacterium]